MCGDYLIVSNDLFSKIEREREREIPKIKQRKNKDIQKTHRFELDKIMGNHKNT